MHGFCFVLCQSLIVKRTLQTIFNAISGAVLQSKYQFNSGVNSRSQSKTVRSSSFTVEG